MRLTNTIAAILAASALGFSGAALAGHHEEGEGGVIGAATGAVEAVADAVTGGDDAAEEDADEGVDEDSGDDGA
ncbi:MAG: hypothetical protein ACPG06_07180, partial [Alphaproteobacteria bacterium]